MRSQTKITTVAAAVATAVLTAGVAFAATQNIERYPTWTISPDDTEAQNHKGKLTFNLGSKFPDAGYTVKKSVFDGEDTELLNGTDGEDWFTKDTPFGAEFGPTGPNAPEVNKVRYLKIRVGGPSVATATYTFKRPTPAGTLGFAVSDIDLDRLRITAKDASGRAVAGSDLAGDVFNFCNVPAAGRPPECGSRETITPRLKNLSNGVILTSRDGEETQGAAAWFKPTVKIKQITFVFREVGSSGPSFRTWFAAKVKKQTQPVTG
ncbi:MAG: hypothetical protein ACKOBH_00305 [bacterium]